MTQSPPDKMPDEIWAKKSTRLDGGMYWIHGRGPTTRYLNAATLADDLARVEEMMKLYTNPENYEGCGRHDPVVFENGDYGSTAKEALTIIRRLRGNQ